MDRTIDSEQTKSSEGEFAKIAGYSGHIPRSHSDPGYLGKTNFKDFASPRPLLETPEKTKTPRTLGTSQAVLAIQGYRGHIPGKSDIIGHTFTVATSRGVDGFLAATNKCDRQVPHMFRRTSAPGVEPRRGSGVRPGKSIPGYTGYIPGVKPDTCGLGLTVTGAILQADRIQKQVRNRAQREDRPSSAPKVASAVANARGDAALRSGRSETQREDRPNSAHNVAPTVTSGQGDDALRSVKSGRSSGPQHEKTRGLASIPSSVQAGSMASGRHTERSHRSRKSEVLMQAESGQRSERSGRYTERSHRSEGSTTKHMST